MKFQSEIQSDIYGFEKLIGIDADVDFGKPKINIDWNVEIEARSWGIKSISAFVTKITGNLYWEVWADDVTEDQKKKLIAAGGKEMRNNTIEGSVELDSNSEYKGKKWNIDSNLEFEDDSISPNDCDIDFETMTISIN